MGGTSSEYYQGIGYLSSGECTAIVSELKRRLKMWEEKPNFHNLVSYLSF